VRVVASALGGQRGVGLGAAPFQVSQPRRQHLLHLAALPGEGLGLSLDGERALSQHGQALGLGSTGELLLLDAKAALGQQRLFSGDGGLPGGGPRGGGVVVGRCALLGPQRRGLGGVPVAGRPGGSGPRRGGGGLRGVGGLRGLRAAEARLFFFRARGIARRGRRAGLSLELPELRRGSAGLANGLRG